MVAKFCVQTLEDEHPLVMCLDGNFGLVRKRSSGESFEQPKHGTRIFIADDDVAAYVDNYGDTGKADDMVYMLFVPFSVIL